MKQWRVTVTDNHGETHEFGVAAEGPRAAEDKAKQYLKRQAAKGTWPVMALAKPAEE